MSDRDLLEAAARAGGYKPVRWTDDGTALLLEGVQEPWNALHPNPHSDCMGDALRLAVKLNLRVDCYDNQVETMDGCAPYKIGPETFTNTFVCIEPTDGGQDRLAATCRAIVRAAAALTQPEGGA